MENLKFMYNGIKIDGKLHKGHWSKSQYLNGAEFAFYSDDYSSKELRQHFKVKNDSDIMTDYFEKDTIYFMPNDEHIEEVRIAWKQNELRLINKCIKNYEKRLQKNPSSIYCQQELKYYKNRLKEIA